MPSSSRSLRFCESSKIVVGMGMVLSLATCISDMLSMEYRFFYFLWPNAIVPPSQMVRNRVWCNNIYSVQTLNEIEFFDWLTIIITLMTEWMFDPHRIPG